jgi:preprotein translocase subunit SecD
MLAVVGLLLAALYAGLFTGKNWSPSLGLDLRGGTSVTLTAKALPGGRITPASMTESVNIIRQRVNGLGVSNASVQTEGSDNIVVETPGKGRSILTLVGQTAVLRFRQVMEIATGLPLTTRSPTPSTTPSASSKPASIKPSATPTKNSAFVQSLPKVHRRPVAKKTASPTSTPSPSVTPTPATSTAGPWSGEHNASAQALQSAFLALNCQNRSELSPGSRVDTDPVGDYIISCSQDGTTKYLLGPAKVVGSEIKSASVGTDPTTGAPDVNLSFNGQGTTVWGNWTTTVTKLPAMTSSSCAPPGAAPTGCNGIAVVLDDQVVSAPSISTPILGGNSMITGGNGGFSQSQATNLADVLKYGALPLRFVTSQAETISASLGSDQLRGGLIAGLIGLGLVILYSLLYYRGLGLVTIASLALSAGLLYPTIVLLGRSSLGYTLTLAGIAGFIVAVGITADSFVVFFERIRDEVREGRTLRSAVERAWPRARRTILSADTVSFLAALVLWLLSIGDVRGFAFTLGLSTLSDLFIVFFFTKPLLTRLARTRLYGSGGRFSGLSADRMGRALAQAPAGTARSRPAAEGKI